MDEQKFVERVRSAGGRAFLVGGYVRDLVIGRPPKDRDYVVSGLATAFCSLFPEAKRVGKSFPVYLMEVGGASCEVAFARRERKNGHGYRGFIAESDASITIEEDLFRRDTTMNSMALELPERRVIDPYGGRGDIERKIIRAVSPHFLEDPVRALRAARQAAELGFSISGETIAYMRECREELALEPTERMFGELRLALKTERPSVFFRCMEEAGLLETTFPELFDLIGKTQPAAFHPEGDAFEHTMQIVDSVAEATRPATRMGAKRGSPVDSPDALVRTPLKGLADASQERDATGLRPQPRDDPQLEEHTIAVRFAALAHDLGKGTTHASMLPHHYGHEKRGLDVLARWNRRMTLPKLWMDAASFAIAQHMRAPRMKRPGKIVDLLVAVSKSRLGVRGFCHIIRADHKSLPPYLAHAEDIIALLAEVSGECAPAGLRGKEIASWIRAEQTRKYLLWSKNTRLGGEPD